MFFFFPNLKLFLPLATVFKQGKYCILKVMMLSLSSLDLKVLYNDSISKFSIYYLLTLVAGMSLRYFMPFEFKLFNSNSDMPAVK